MNDACLARCYFFSIGPRGSRGTVDAGPRGAGASGGVGDEASYRSGRGAARAVARASRARGSRRRTHLPQERGPGRGDAVRILPELVLEGLQVRRARAGDELVLHPRVRRRGGARGAARGGGVRPRLERAERRGRDPAAQRARATPWWSGGATANPREAARRSDRASTSRGSAEGEGAARRRSRARRRGVSWHRAGSVRRGAGGRRPEPTETSTTIRERGPPCEQPGGKISPRRERFQSSLFAGRCPSFDFSFFHPPFSQKPSRVPPPPFVLPSSVPSPFLRRPRSPPHPPITRRRSSS